MTDPVDRLAGFSGQSREALLGIWDAVRANQAKLAACPRHDFGDLGPSPHLGKRFTCRNCGGWADAHAVHWYRAGLAHGGGHV